MNEQVLIQAALRNALLETQSRNPSFSVRAFSKKLGLPVSAINEIIKGQRRVSKTYAIKLCDRLMLSSEIRTKIERAFNQSSRLKSTPLQEDSEYRTLSADQFDLISDPIHYSILSLMKTKNFKSKTDWIASRLNRSITQVQSAIDRLQRLGLIENTAQGGLRRISKKLKTIDGQLDQAIQKSHRIQLENAIHCLNHIDVNDRDFTAMTFTFDPSLWPQVRKIIRQAQDQIEALSEVVPATEVYQICTQVFPMTRLMKGPANHVESKKN